MVKGFLRIFFRCRHKHISQPFPAEMAHAGSSSIDWDPMQPITSNHYVVCLDCGKRFSYDWTKMQVVKSR